MLRAQAAVIHLKASNISSLITSSQAYRFAEDVLSGKIISGKRRKQACQRFIDELERSQKHDYPWTFDIQKAYRPIDFMERFLVPTKGDYDKMELLPWQHFVEANLFGWVAKKNGLRRFREGVVFVGSGNGKSTLITGNAVYGASKDDERGAEVYCIANAKDQARIIFDECKAQIEASPMLKKHFRCTRDGVYFDKTASKIQALASDPKTLDGKNVHLAIFDEVQDYQDYKFMSRLKKKIIKRRQPLIVYISTSGNVIDGPLMDLYVLGGQILDNNGAISPVVADRMFVYIDEIDENDDPDDITCWGKANPSLGKLIMLEDLIADWERCKLVPAERSDWINKQLNVFTLVDELSFLDIQTIRKNNREISLEKLKGQLCYGGFDLAETNDFCSACLEFPLPNNDFFVLEHSWVPRKKIKEDKEKLDWITLEKDGVLTFVDKDYVEYELVLEWFLKQRELYRIDSIGYDPAKAFMLVNEMQRNGFILNEVRQGELTLTNPLDNLRERFIDGNIIHNNNKLFYWYLGNVKLTKRGPNATYLPTKQNKNRKIDGFAALLNAHCEWMRKHPTYIAPDKKVSTVLKIN
jgi:phage terminase large subunit-like protein